MKKFALLLLLPVLFWGCEKTYDSVVNPKQNNTIQVTNIARLDTSSNSTVDSVDYLTSDSVLTFAISFNSTEQIQSVQFNIVSPAGTQLNSSPITLYNDGDLSAHGDASAGDTTFSNKFTMSNSYLSGVYIVKYYVTDIYNSSNYISAQNFVFDNGKNRFAPVLSNLNLPDTVSIGQTFIFSVMAVDSNGYDDIELVYYELYKPDGTKVTNSQGISQFPLFDDGATSTNGDVTANDSTYTVFLTFPSGQPTGSWRFEFQALDRTNLLSNKITQNVELIQ
ncbi:MAG TPA: hypothetical protein VKD08_10435 [Ignavibacteriaceae bacterium]|nr:hypothetical protein [Ignavibacteriaceae bacterium]